MSRAIGGFGCLLVLALDVAAGVLGIQAEIAQNKEKHMRLLIFECKEPSHEAFMLGVAAASLLALAHVIANLLGAYVCFSKGDYEKSSASKQISTACFILSWIVVAVGFSVLIVGTMSNSKSRASCGITHHRYLSTGGILCFVHGLFCVSYYISASATTT
ncbi:Protein DESIGUAL 2 [Ranunculus cassubicifolius]